MTEPGEPVEVLSGTADGGLRWVVVTSGTDQDLYTMLNVYRDVSCWAAPDSAARSCIPAR